MLKKHKIRLSPALCTTPPLPTQFPQYAHIDEVEDERRAAGAEVELLAAVLRRAILDAIGSTEIVDNRYNLGHLPRIMYDARHWLKLGLTITDEDIKTAKPMSFPWVCEHLNLNTHIIHEKISNFVNNHPRVQKQRTHIKKLFGDLQYSIFGAVH